MRIAKGGIATGCCTLSPILSKEDDFVIQEGQAVLDYERYLFLNGVDATDGIKDCIAFLKVEGITTVITHKRHPFHFEHDFLNLT